LNNFFRRTLTGAWIVIFVLGGFWLHPLSFFLTGFVLLAGSLYEYYMLIRSTGVKPQMIPGIITGLAAYTVSTLVASGFLQMKYLLLLIPVVLIIMIAELFRRQDKPFDSLAHTCFPLIYSAVPFSIFPFAAFSRTGIESLLPHGNIIFSPGIIVGFLILLWVNDSGAYITGSLIGKHRLMERISPKKSWEGIVGGAVFSALAAWLISGWLGVVDTQAWIIISVIVSVAGPFGDLVESMLKRSIGVKDSGNIMPGHGGFLDRFDSTVFSFPLVFLFISFFG
jgi:phosphatidate cytidylyltransferase